MQLLIEWDLCLYALSPIGRDLHGDSIIYPSNSIVVELSNGFYGLPDEEHEITSKMDQAGRLQATFMRVDRTKAPTNKKRKYP